MARIAVVAHKDFPGGVRERREVDALCDAGHEVDLLCLRRPGQALRETSDRLRIYRLPISHKRAGKFRYFFEYLVFFLLSTAILSSLQLRRRYALVQVHNIPDFLVFSAWLPRLQGARVILDIRDPMPETFQFKYGLGPEDRFIKIMILIEQVSVRFADHVLTVHEPLRQVHIDRGCPPERITAIMNLPDERIFQADSEYLWPRSSPPNFALIYTGTLGKRHGVQTALRAIPSLAAKIPGIRLHIIGDGEYFRELRELTERLRVSQFVVFESTIPLDEIPARLGKADVGFALQEGLFGKVAFPTKVAEYIAMKLPAIVTRTELTARYFTEEMVAFVPPGDVEAFSAQVYDLYSDHSYGQRLIANSCEFLKNRSWAKEKKRYLDIIERLAS